MNTYLVHDGEKIINRIVADKKPRDAKNLKHVKVTASIDGNIGDKVNTNGTIERVQAVKDMEELKAEALANIMAIAERKFKESLPQYAGFMSAADSIISQVNAIKSADEIIALDIENNPAWP